MRNVVFVVPFPLETTMRFVRALRRLKGVRLLGLLQKGSDDQGAFDDVLRADNAFDVGQLAEGVAMFRERHGDIHRLVGVLEPLQELLAQVREALDIEGPRVATAMAFRDKARMKDLLRKHHLPCARHQLIGSPADARRFVGEVGLPFIIKPPAGQACKATWRIQSLEQAQAALAATQARPDDPMLGEEMVRGREHSFETLTVGGKARFHSISRYYPSPLEVMESPWIQWVVILPRNISGPEYDEARRVGNRAVEVLGLEDGFTHMEWWQRDGMNAAAGADSTDADSAGRKGARKTTRTTTRGRARAGTAKKAAASKITTTRRSRTASKSARASAAPSSIAIGEIAARPPGAQFVRMTGVAHATDMYLAWARAVVDGAFDGPWDRKYAVGACYLRGPGRGRVTHITGVSEANRRVGPMVFESNLPPLGAPKSDTYEGDGYVLIRHPDTEVVKAACKTVIETVRIHYA